jgi:hypothetical protein
MGNGILNPELRETLEAWTQAVAVHVAPRTAFQSKETSIRQLQMELLLPHSNISGMDETRLLLGVIEQSPAFKWHANRGWRFGNEEVSDGSTHALKLIGRLLEFCVADSEGLLIEPSTFAEVYEELEDYLYRFENISIHSTIELWHVRPEVSEISVTPNITIRPLTESEEARSRNSSLALGRFDSAVTKPPAPPLLVEIAYRIEELASELSINGLSRKRYTTSLFPKAAQIGVQLLSTLRLLGEGLIWLGTLSSHSSNRFIDQRQDQDMSSPQIWRKIFTSPISSFGFGNDPVVGLDSPPYRMTADIAQKLPKLWNPYDIPPSQPVVELALRRFRTSFERDSLIDRFVDHWIALESLFGDSSDRGAVKDQLCRRLAEFNAGSREEFSDAYQRCRNAYASRSSVVHGREVEPQRFRLHVFDTEHYLRRSLIKCLEENIVPDKKVLGI